MTEKKEDCHSLLTLAFDLLKLSFSPLKLSFSPLKLSFSFLKLSFSPLKLSFRAKRGIYAKIVSFCINVGLLITQIPRCARDDRKKGRLSFSPYSVILSLLCHSLLTLSFSPYSVIRSSQTVILTPQTVIPSEARNLWRKRFTLNSLNPTISHPPHRASARTLYHTQHRMTDCVTTCGRQWIGTLCVKRRAILHHNTLSSARHRLM